MADKYWYNHDEMIFLQNFKNGKLKPMENKYYTPEISEFHVGFECERFVDGDWQKIVMSVNFLSLEDIDEEISLNEIRVKYLDREDIENCGWSFEQQYGGTQKLNFNKDMGGTDMLGISSDLFLDYNLENNHTLISYYGDGDVTIFTGTIKNKSELIRIMKQTGISN